MPAAWPDSLVEHDLDVLVQPERHALAGRDRLSLPPGTAWDLVLRAGFEVQLIGEGTLEPGPVHGHLRRYRLRRETPGPVILRYAGVIAEAWDRQEAGMGRAQSASFGFIGEEGVYLDGHSGWYPRIGDRLQRLRLRVQLPTGWSAVSQGAGPDRQETATGVQVSWREDHPQEDLYLVAGRFSRHARATPWGEVQAYLRAPEADLAAGYLEAGARYLGLYSELLGAYPYAKFALVENFWETGYGMPSFTLLGPKVLRLPFVVHTSYPHEILHNWWGNGVYIDPEEGNWSEGLTAYLADHLLAETRGQGADYRRDSLRAYADFVPTHDDFPLRAFRSRRDEASQAIGYGKMLLVWHMLRRELGDTAFIAGLRRFYREQGFRRAGFVQWQAAFEAVSGRDLGDFFTQWTTRTGAPDLALEGVVAAPDPAGGYQVRGRLIQRQEEAPFALSAPLVFHTQDGLVERRLPLAGRQTAFAFDLPARPLRLDLDPRFDLFRRLAPGETPVAFSALFGAPEGLFVTPAAAAPELAAGYRALAQAWQRGAPGWRRVADDQLEALPGDRPVWVLGWENRFAAALASPEAPFQLTPAARHFQARGEPSSGRGDSVVLVTRAAGPVRGLVATETPAALPGLTRKLPHYGKYSHLTFTGAEPVNRRKGRWPAGESRLAVWLAEARPLAPVPPWPALTDALAPPQPP